MVIVIALSLIVVSVIVSLLRGAMSAQPPASPPRPEPPSSGPVAPDDPESRTRAEADRLDQCPVTTRVVHRPQPSGRPLAA